MSARDTIRRFWELQDGGDYSRVVDLFAPDAVFVDPIYGTLEGKAAIGDFMVKMVTEVAKINGRFELEELAGDEYVAWASWIFHSDRGERSGVGVYRVEDGLITYYRDYMNERA